MFFRSILKTCSTLSLPFLVLFGMMVLPASADESESKDETAVEAAENAGEDGADDAAAEAGGDGTTGAEAETTEDSTAEATDAPAEGSTADNDGTSADHAGHDDSSADTKDHGDGKHAGDDHGGDADHGDGHGGGHETGVPGWKSDLALWSLITFVCFLFVLKKAAWGPLINGLDQREAGIRAAIADAEENQRKSQAMLAEYEEKLRGAEQTVADMVAEAKRDAERTSEDIVAKAQADVEAMRERATEDIAQAKDKALAEVFGSVNQQVAMATERVLGRALSDDDQDRLIQEALTEIS